MPARKTAGNPASGRPSAKDDAARRPTGTAGAGGRDQAGGTRLVIVESPAKAKTISGYLGPGWTVESSIGHIRDLPANAATVPDAYKGQQWARLGVNVDNGFEPLYVVMPDKQAQVRKLKALLAGSQELYLATDEDREGEAIAWHLRETLKPRVPVRRMVFHEITRQAIEHAADHPRDIDQRLVDAQETRRILDRLYGYEVSPVLWKKVRPGLSAGRVQSVATRILVERERERIRFRTASYWGIDGTFAADRSPSGGADSASARPAQPALPAALVGLNGRRIATGRDFSESGKLTSPEVVLLDEAAARGLADRLADVEFTVRRVEEKPYRRSPYPPFMTSTLQQEAGRKLRFSSQRTMQVAQRLYENGYITYMRTDSTTLSETAVAAARTQARDLYGPDYVPDQPRTYTRKVKNAQEAHEAIRPAGETFRTPGQVAGELSADERRLYELIWQRTIASQMADARGTSVAIRLGGISIAGEDAEFSATGKVISFPGFLRAYVEGADDPTAELEDRERRLPPVKEGDPLTVLDLIAEGHATQPPARYTEASLVKTLEELGIGRPSTYASIIGTIQDRGYAFRKGSALVPTFTAFAVVNLLEDHFSRLVDYGFTAEVEDDLDEIAAGERASTDWLTRFYFGTGEGNGNGKSKGSAAATAGRAAGLKSLVDERLGEIDAREVNSIPLGEDEGGVALVVRVGRYGPYVQRGAVDGSERASIDESIPPDELTVEKALELLHAPSQDRVLGTDPATGEEVAVRIGRFGAYVQRGEGKDPARASLFVSMTPESVTLDDALRLLTLPRTVGVAPDGEEITARTGRYGPFVKKGSQSRSLAGEEDLFTVTLEQALALFAQPKSRGRGAAAPPLRELGPDRDSGRPIVVKEGRFGPYVTDGEVNASLRQGDSVEEIDLNRAAELLADRRARAAAAPPKAPRARKAASAAKGRPASAAPGEARKAGGAKAGAGTARTGKAGGGRPRGRTNGSADGGERGAASS